MAIALSAFSMSLKGFTLTNDYQCFLCKEEIGEKERALFRSCMLSENVTPAYCVICWSSIAPDTVACSFAGFVKPHDVKQYNSRYWDMLGTDISHCYASSLEVLEIYSSVVTSYHYLNHDQIPVVFSVVFRNLRTDKATINEVTEFMRVELKRRWPKVTWNI